MVMDDVLGLASKSDNFANFLTISRKFNFTCVYFFHTIYHTRSNWQMILSQKKFFNIFPGSLQTSFVIKILSSYSNRYTYEYIPHRDLWLNRLYFEISNSSKKQCLTIDMRHVNDLGAAKFRTGAKNNKGQVCYYNYNKKDGAFNRFLTVRSQTSTDAIVFSIVDFIDKSKRYKDICFKISDELREFNNVSLQPEPTIRRASEDDATRRTNTKHYHQQQRQKQQQQQQHQQQQQQNNNRGRVSKKPQFLSG